MKYSRVKELFSGSTTGDKAPRNNLYNNINHKKQRTTYDESRSSVLSCYAIP